MLAPRSEISALLARCGVGDPSMGRCRRRRSFIARTRAHSAGFLLQLLVLRQRACTGCGRSPIIIQIASLVFHSPF